MEPAPPQNIAALDAWTTPISCYLGSSVASPHCLQCRGGRTRGQTIPFDTDQSKGVPHCGQQNIRRQNSANGMVSTAGVIPVQGGQRMLSASDGTSMNVQKKTALAISFLRRGDKVSLQSTASVKNQAGKIRPRLASARGAVRPAASGHRVSFTDSRTPRTNGTKRD